MRGLARSYLEVLLLPKLVRGHVHGSRVDGVVVLIHRLDRRLLLYASHASERERE